MVWCGQVTVRSDDHTKVVARSGSLSVFAALEECCPSCVRDESTTSGRRGLTMIEFNKVLEKGGFTKMRDRRVDATTREDDPTGGKVLPPIWPRNSAWQCSDQDMAFPFRQLACASSALSHGGGLKTTRRGGSCSKRGSG
jgi:hypothetical protein